ncbi:MAG: hypothetical protein V7767_04705 [Leeuwenhoekiella sp.]
MGKVYAEDHVLADVLVRNITQDKRTVTDENGDFTIDARLNDSIVFASSFHEKIGFKIEQFQLDEVWVVELKERLNELDQVNLVETRNDEFSVQNYSKDFNESIKKDIEDKNGLYNAPPNGNGNLMGLVSLIPKLFKSKKPKYKAVDYNDLVNLFDDNRLFNKKLLVDQLNIPEKYHNLFFEYVGAKNINYSLLDEKNQFQLLDRLVNYSVEFQDIIKEYESAKE